MKAQAPKLFRKVLIIAGSVVLIALLADRCTVEVPTTQRIGEFAAGDLTVELRPQFYPPYDLVIGVPGRTEAPPPFRGVIEVQSPDGTVRRIPIASDTAQHCSWLRDPAITGFVLAWDAPQQFSNIFHRGATYRIRVSFTEPLPTGCSFWFASMKHVSIITNRGA